MIIKPQTVFATNNGSWSIHGRIMPFIDQHNAYVKVNLDVAWDAQLATGVPQTRIPAYFCPSDVNDMVRTNAGNPYVYPHTYGFKTSRNQRAADTRSLPVRCNQLITGWCY
jgi:hypothetical protein